MKMDHARSVGFVIRIIQKLGEIFVPRREERTLKKWKQSGASNARDGSSQSMTSVVTWMPRQLEPVTVSAANEAHDEQIGPARC